MQIKPLHIRKLKEIQKQIKQQISNRYDYNKTPSGELETPNGKDNGKTVLANYYTTSNLALKNGKVLTTVMLYKVKLNIYWEEITKWES